MKTNKSIFVLATMLMWSWRGESVSLISPVPNQVSTGDEVYVSNNAYANDPRFTAAYNMLWTCLNYFPKSNSTSPRFVYSFQLMHVQQAISLASNAEGIFTKPLLRSQFLNSVTGLQNAWLAVRPYTMASSNGGWVPASLVNGLYTWLVAVTNNLCTAAGTFSKMVN